MTIATREPRQPGWAVVARGQRSLCRALAGYPLWAAQLAEFDVYFCHEKWKNTPPLGSFQLEFLAVAAMQAMKKGEL